MRYGVRQVLLWVTIWNLGWGFIAFLGSIVCGLALMGFAVLIAQLILIEVFSDLVLTRTKRMESIKRLHGEIGPAMFHVKQSRKSPRFT